jgi:SNF2 family DNA or RNA helicase
MSVVSKKRPLESPEVHQPNKKRRIEPDLLSFVNVSLPKEIMLEIFEYLYHNDKLKCSEVCKYWLDCASASMTWVVVGVDDYEAFWHSNHLFYVDVPKDKMRTMCRKFNQHFAPGEELAFTVEAGEIEKRAAGNFKPYYIKFRNFDLEPKNFSGITFFCHDSGKIYDSTNTKRQMFVIISDLIKSLPDQGKFDSESIKSPLIKIEANAMKVMEAAEPAVKIKYLCNAFELENFVNSGEKIELENFLINTGVVREVAQFMAKEGPKLLELNQAMFPFMPPKLDAPKGLKVEFKFHQYQLDAISWMNAIESDVDKEFKYCDLVPWRASRSSVLVDLHSTKFVASDRVSDYIGSFKSKGGVLADAVGLGKTVEVIGLTLLSQNKEEKLPEFDEKGLFNTRATLVVCPNHLAQQWADEIKKYTDLNVILYTTLENIKSLTYGDVVSAGFVIATSTLFKNKSFFGLGCGNKKVTVSIPGVEKRAGHLIQHLEKVKSGGKLSESAPVLDNFRWERVIVDEAHEVFTDPVVERCVSGIPKSYGWYVSATPFPKPELYSAAKRFLEIWPIDLVPENTIGEQYEKWIENDLIYSNLIWRNIKESIASEYTVPDYIEEVVYVDFSPIETLLHKQSTYEANIKLCCVIFNYPSVDEIPLFRIEELNGVIARLEISISHCEDDIKKTEKAIAEYETNPIFADMLPAQKKRKINRNKNTIKDKKSSIKSYQNQIKDKEEQRDEWPKVPLILGAAKDSISDKDELAYKTMRNKKGSKMAKLILWLKNCIKEDDENRFILFSKFPLYLGIIETILQQSEINSVMLEGNVTQKTKKLKQFKEENVKVLLLCLSDAASGTNLIEANYVVLLDPMQGSIEEARAYELQALGRAHRQGQDQRVHLVRFVVRDSVEEELYMRNKSSGRSNASANRPMLARSSSLASSQQLFSRANSALGLTKNTNNNE